MDTLSNVKLYHVNIAGNTLSAKGNGGGAYIKEELEERLVPGSGADCQHVFQYYAGCDSCDAVSDSVYFDGTAYGEHKMSADWETENEQYYHYCTVEGCDHREDEASCSGGTATCEEKAKCGTCGEEYGTAKGHTWEEKVENDLTLVEGSGSDCQHTYIYYVGCTECDAINKEMTFDSGKHGSHSMSDAWTTENETHFHVCTVEGCDHRADVTPCSGGEATCTEKAACEVCGEAYGSLKEHAYEESWSHGDESGHWHVCADCGGHDEPQPHNPGAEATEDKAQLCTDCGRELQPQLPHTHKLSKVAGSAATCTESGKQDAWQCVCGALFADEKAEQPVADPEDLVIPALGHQWADATCTTPKTCSRCDAEEGAAAGHSFGDWKQTIAPTEEAEGEEQRTCAVCGETESRKVEKLPGEAPWVNPFVDVQEDDFFYESVKWAFQNEITTGKDETHFAPTMDCTRAQVVTFLWRAAGEPEPKTEENPFPDVHGDAYYYKAVLWAVEEGITNGFKDGTFGPKKTCTRGQIVAFIWRYADQPEPADPHNPFPDVKESAYYAKAVLWAVEEGITNGFKDGSFGPNKNCTRDQIVTFLYRYLAEQ